MTSVFLQPNLYPYTPDSTDVLSVIPYLVAREVVTYNDANNTNQTLTLGATSNIQIEARSNIDLFVGSNAGAFRLYETSVSNATRTDTPIFTICASNSYTQILGGDGRGLVAQGLDTSNTTIIGNTTLASDAYVQYFSTTKRDGFSFQNSMAVQGTQVITGNSITMGNVYGTNVNVWAQKDTPSNDRIGFGFRINDKDQLELVKYSRFLLNSNNYKTITKKVAVFGQNLFSSNDVSDANYLVFDTLNGLSFSNDQSAFTNSSVWTSTLNSSNESAIYYTTDSNLSSGCVGIGTSNPIDYKLVVVGDIFAHNDVLVSSDARIKTDLVPIPNALDKVNHITGYTYKRLDMENSTRYAGVVAQELLPILPEVVHQNSEGLFSVAYGNMVALLIEAIKELSAKVDQLLA